MTDRVYMLISRPPKYAVSQLVGFIKGKSAIHLARVYREKRRNFGGRHFRARGYFVSGEGRCKEMIREYILNQEHEDQRLGRLTQVKLPALSGEIYKLPEQSVWGGSPTTILGSCTGTVIPLDVSLTIRVRR